MRKYLTLGLIITIIVTVLAFFIKFHPFSEQETIGIKDNWAIRHVAERNNVPIETLLPLLPPEKRSDPATTLLNLHVPIKDLNLNKTEIETIIKEAQAEGFPWDSIVRYILWAFWLTGAGLVLINRKKIKRTRIVWHLITLTIFGIILGAAPNPMEAIVKLHKLILQIPGNPLIFVIANFIIFTLLSIMGAKMLCSWGCQFGALQESIYNLPFFKNFKKKYKLPFSASIAVRTTIYLTFFILFFKILNINQGGAGSIFYHHFNVFKIYDFYDLALFTVLLLPFVLGASLFVFRPFCHLICPFGFYSWFLENLAIYKVQKIDVDACDNCKQCEKACPTEAMKATNLNTRQYFRPDCWSCGRCIEACPNGLIRFLPRKSGAKDEQLKIQVIEKPFSSRLETQKESEAII